MDNERKNPANLKPSADRLLREASYAVALTDPETARSECRVESDAELHHDDERAGETIYTNALVDSLTIRDSLIAPIVRALAGRRSQSVKRNYAARSTEASRERLKLIAEVQESGRHYVTFRTMPEASDGANLVMSPLVAHWTRSNQTMLLNPYQIQACGVIEVVRAAGRHIGNQSGDWLADQFMRLIIDLSGEGNWEDGARQIDGEFLKMAERSEEVPEEWLPLTGRKQLLAVTVLAAWLRMSRLGVLLVSRDRLTRWGEFFDGTMYGVNIKWLGEVWDQKAKRQTDCEIAEPWRAHPEPPCLAESDGSPVPVVGLAGELLKSAITTVQAVGMVPDDFVIEEETDLDPRYERSNRTLVHLKRVYREIAGSPIGSVISVSAPDHWD